MSSETPSDDTPQMPEVEFTDEDVVAAIDPNINNDVADMLKDIKTSEDADKATKEAGDKLMVTTKEQIIAALKPLSDAMDSGIQTIKNGAGKVQDLFRSMAEDASDAQLLAGEPPEMATDPERAIHYEELQSMKPPASADKKLAGLTVETTASPPGIILPPVSSTDEPVPESTDVLDRATAPIPKTPDDSTVADSTDAYIFDGEEEGSSTDTPDESSKEGGSESSEKTAESPAVKEMKEHFGSRYDSMTPEQREVVMKVIEGMDPKQAQALADSYKVLTPAEREIYDKAGPRIANKLSQLSPEDIRLYFQGVVETDPKKLIAIHDAMSPAAITFIMADAVNYSKAEYEVWDKLHTEYDRLSGVEGGSEKSELSPQLNETLNHLSELLVKLFEQILSALGVEGLAQSTDDEDSSEGSGDKVSENPKEQAAALKEGVDAKKKNLDGMDKQIKTQEGALDDLKTQQAELQTKIEVGGLIGEDLAKAETELNALTTKITEAETALATLKEERKALAKDIEGDEKKIVALESAGEGDSVLTDKEQGAAKEAIDGAVGTALTALEAAFPGINIDGLREALGEFTPDQLNIDGTSTTVLKLGAKKGILHELFPEGTQYITAEGIQKAITDLRKPENADKLAKITEMIKVVLPKASEKPDDKTPKDPEKPDDKTPKDPEKPDDKTPENKEEPGGQFSVPPENTDKPPEATPKSVELSAEFIKQINLAKEGLSASMDQAVGSIQRRVDMYRAHVKGTQEEIDNIGGVSYLNPFNMGLRSRLKSTLASEKASLESAQNAMSKIVSARDQVRAIVNDTDNTKTGEERMQDIKDGVKLVEGIRGMVKDTDYAKIGESLRDLDANLAIAEAITSAPIKAVEAAAGLALTPALLLADLAVDGWEMGSEQLAALGEWSGPQWDAFVEGAEFYGNYVVDGLVDTAALTLALGAEGMQLLSDGTDYLVEEGGVLIDLATTAGKAYVAARIKEGTILAADFAKKGTAAMNTVVGLGLYVTDVAGDALDATVDSIADLIQPGMEWGNKAIAASLKWGGGQWEAAAKEAGLWRDGAVILTIAGAKMGEAALNKMTQEVDHYVKVGGEIVDIANAEGQKYLATQLKNAQTAATFLADNTTATINTAVGLGLYVAEVADDALDATVDSIAVLIQPGMEWGEEAIAASLEWGGEQWEAAAKKAGLWRDGTVNLAVAASILGEKGLNKMLAEVDHYQKIGGKIVDMATDAGQEYVRLQVEQGKMVLSAATAIGFIVKEGAEGVYDASVNTLADFMTPGFVWTGDAIASAQQWTGEQVDSFLSEVDWVTDGVVDTGKMGLALSVAIGDGSMNALIDSWDGVVTIGNNVVQLSVIPLAKLEGLVKDAGAALNHASKEYQMIQKELERRGSTYTGLGEKTDDDTG
ncbi:MAG: hypothetical protein O2904_02895 [bacterium]|nr:hypothetical protein [bacterium]